MPTINYKEALITRVIDGTKPHTIHFGKRIYKVGQTAIHCTGNRTPNRKEHRRDLITSVTRINIKFQPNDESIWINGWLISDRAMRELAQNDGFKSYTEFINFFKATHGENFDIDGLLIQWGTPINYNQL